MEMEELKNLLQAYDKSLQETKLLNEQLIMHMLQEKSGSRIARLLRAEYLSAAVSAIVLVLFGFIAGCNTAQILGPYIISVLLLAASTAWSLYKIIFLLKTDLPEAPVSEAALRVQRFQLMITRERIWIFILVPVLMAALMPVLLQWLYHKDIMDMWQSYLARWVAGCIIFYISAYFIYGRLYFHNLKLLSKEMEEIRAFTKAA